MPWTKAAPVIRNAPGLTHFRRCPMRTGSRRWPPRLAAARPVGGAERPRRRLPAGAGTFAQHLRGGGCLCFRGPGGVLAGPPADVAGRDGAGGGLVVPGAAPGRTGGAGMRGPGIPAAGQYVPFPRQRRSAGGSPGGRAGGGDRRALPRPGSGGVRASAAGPGAVAAGAGGAGAGAAGRGDAGRQGRGGVTGADRAAVLRGDRRLPSGLCLRPRARVDRGAVRVVPGAAATGELHRHLPGPPGRDPAARRIVARGHSRGGTRQRALQDPGTTGGGRRPVPEGGDSSPAR